MNLKNIFFIFIVLLLSINIFAFTTFPTAILSVDKDMIEVGQTINATVTIEIPSFAKLLQMEDDFFIEGWDIQDFSFKQDISDDSRYFLNVTLTTFDYKIKQIPRIKLSYVNKADFLDDSFFCEKYYFFSNSIPVTVVSVFDNYQRNSIFDIKKIKMLYIPIFFYVICSIFFLFVLFSIYIKVVGLKIKKFIKINFSPKENAIRKMNNIYTLKGFDENKVRDYYYLISDALKTFITEELKIKKIEFTTTEVLALISEDGNIFKKHYYDIKSFFKIYDDAKFSAYLVDKDKFIEIFEKTKKFIENIEFNIEKGVEEQNASL
jgi:hypothetical protein